jgi:hypothetical protein
VDEQVIKYYRKLLRYGFEYAGSIEYPSIYLDSVGERIRVCGHNDQNYLHLYIDISEDRVKEIKYLCTCDPTANVVFEVLCYLAKNKTLKALENINEASFSNVVGSQGEDFLKKAKGILELLNRGIQRYKSQKT